MTQHPGNIDERVLQEFESAWLANAPISIAQSLESVAPDCRLPTLVELVMIDIEFGWKTKVADGSDPQLLESYLEQFPELTQPDLLHKLLEEEYRVRHRHGDQPRFEDFEKRFPTIVDSLLFTQVDSADSANFDQVPSSQIRIGTVIDKFTITGEVGQGGMGQVFTADQSEPVRRKVALKVIKSGLNSREVIARFEAERQALAIMEHQNIARILDGGTTGDGRPWFAMELVQGVAITDYCDDRRMGLKERLGLFVDVCSAVQHAHQKGVIHRDLKPSNILVAEYDGRPIPKVIDFGLAKALDSGNKLLSDQSMATNFGQILGTFKYMSPEQADSGTIDIDTRTDVYSLGIILYELLTGSTPLDQRTLKNQAMLKVLELIRDQEPPRPSTRLSSLNESATTVSDRRQMDPGRLSQILRGDLDWVVMKALEKDRGRRYESASGFSEDVQRFLGGEPVLARPPSASYRFQKFVRRNRGLVASLATIAALLIAGIAATSWFAHRASQSAAAEKTQREIADRQTVAAVEQKRLAEEAQFEAEASAKRSTEVLNIVSKSFGSTNPNEGANADMPARQVLFNARKSMQESNLDDLGRAELLKTLTDAFLGLGEFEAAITTTRDHIEILQNAKAELPELMRARNQLANGLMATGQLKQAAELQRQNLDESVAGLGENNRTTLDAMNLLAIIYFKLGRFDESLALAEKTWTGRKKLLGEDHRDTLRALGNLSISYFQAGRLTEALRLKEGVVKALQEKLGMDDPVTLIEMNNLAATYAAAGQIEKSFELKKQLVELSEKKLGPDHAQTLKASSNLAIAYYQMGEFEKSIELNENILAKRKTILGENHQDTLTTMGNLAIVYDVSGRKQEALLLQEKTLVAKRTALGDDHPQTLAEMANLAISYEQADRIEDANRLFQQALDSYTAQFGTGHPATIQAMTNLASNFSKLENGDKAIALYEQSYELAKQVLAPEHQATLTTMKNLAIAYSNSLRPIDAINLDLERFAIANRDLPPSHPDRITATEDIEFRYEHSLAVISLMMASGDFDQSKTILELLRNTTVAPVRLRHEATHLLQILFLEQGDWDQAATPLEKWIADLRTDPNQKSESLASARLSQAIVELESGRIPNAKTIAGEFDSAQLTEVQQLRLAGIKAMLLAHEGDFDAADEQAVRAFTEFEGLFDSLQWSDIWYLIHAARQLESIHELAGNAEQSAEWKSKASETTEKLRQQLEHQPMDAGQ